MRRSLALVVVLSAVWAHGCASGGGKADISILTSSSDEEIWEAGQKAVAKHDFEAARQYFKRIVDGFPQSEHGPEARVAIADSYFNQGGTANYILAISSLSRLRHAVSAASQERLRPVPDRRRLFPSEEYSRIAIRRRSTHALEEYNRLLDLYPSSPYVEKARPQIAACRQNLARGSFMVGYFYQKTRKVYRAAIARYEDVIKDYPDYDGSDEVLYRLSQCLVASGRSPEALPHLQRLRETYPTSRWANEAAKLVAQIEATGAAPVPPAASPAPPAGAAPAPPAGPSPSPGIETP